MIRTTRTMNDLNNSNDLSHLNDLSDLTDLNDLTYLCANVTHTIMILAIDIGNTNIVIALYREASWSNTFRYETKVVQPEFYYENALRSILLEWGISHQEINHCVISSVVPDLNEVIGQAVRFVTGVHPFFITPEVLMQLDIVVPHPYVIGSDLVANAYGAIKTYGDHCIVVDFGTALTFTVVDKSGIVGVTIAPGLKTALLALSSQTAQLPLVNISLPSSAIGHDTTSAIQAGVMWGYVGLVKELLERMTVELGQEYTIVATGGLSTILHPLESNFDVVDKMLTLNGMRLIYEHCQPTSISSHS